LGEDVLFDDGNIIRGAPADYFEKKLVFIGTLEDKPKKSVKRVMKEVIEEFEDVCDDIADPDENDNDEIITTEEPEDIIEKESL